MLPARSLASARTGSARPRDDGRSRLGLVVVVAVLLSVVVIGSVLADRLLNENRISVLDADPGDCFTMPIDPNITELTEIERQDCDEAHDAEVVAVGELNPGGNRSYPDDELLFDLVDVACGDPRRFFDDGFGVLPVAPNERAWNGLRGRFVCVGVSLGGEFVTGRRLTVGDGEDSAPG